MCGIASPAAPPAAHSARAVPQPGQASDPSQRSPAPPSIGRVRACSVSPVQRRAWLAPMIPQGATSLPAAAKHDICILLEHDILILLLHTLEGGVPIMFNGQCVGAVGVSGVKSDQDA